MKIVAETEFGSHLYGLQTPASDHDYKGIILPTKQEILLGRSKYHSSSTTGNTTTKNTCDDVDKTYYTLSYFIELACKGDTTAMDMLHAPMDKVIVNSNIWKFLQDNRTKFYTKNMKAYVGYCRKQAAKYGIKGSRLGELERVINKLNEYPINRGIGDIVIEESDVVRWIVYKGNRYLEVCGSKFQDNLKLSYAKETLEQIFSQYGERTRLAKINQSIDWKALSHAFRVGYQTLHILEDGGFEYPLKESPYLMQIKKGELHFLDVELELTELVNKVNELTKTSNLPDDVDRVFWDEYIAKIHLDTVNY
jgi:hypothetical protein